MVGTAINFLRLYALWILLALGVLFSPVLYGLAMKLIHKIKDEKQPGMSKDAANKIRKEIRLEDDRRHISKEVLGYESYKSKVSRYAGMSKEEWEKFKAKEIERTNAYFEKTGRVYTKPEARIKMEPRSRPEARERRKDGSLNLRERKRIEERTQQHIVNMRKSRKDGV